MTIVQWVNLEKEDIYAQDSDVGSIDRCGPLTLKAVFDKDQVPLNFTVRVVPSGSDNVEYTESEIAPGRNPKFRMPSEIAGLGSQKEVLMDSVVNLPAAGGNKYKLEAKDANGVTVTSKEIEVKRKLYYQVLEMSDTKGRVSGYSLAPMEAHAEKHFIKLQQVGSTRPIPYLKTISVEKGGSIDDFASSIGAAFNIDQKLKKVGIAAVFSDYIAEKGQVSFDQTLTIGSGSHPSIAIGSSAVTIVGNHYLWAGLDDVVDSENGWLVAGGAEYTDSTTGKSERVVFSRKDVALAGQARFTHGGHHQVKIRRSDQLNALLNRSQGTIRFLLHVHVVVGWINGFSWSPGGNQLITCARRVEWEDMPQATREYTWNHEVGHRFGMVAYGDRKKLPHHAGLPDGPSTMYSNLDGNDYGGHRGPHCGKGAVYAKSTNSWSGTPGCVMFGANGIGSHHAPKEYCAECAPIVRKVDLSA